MAHKSWGAKDAQLWSARNGRGFRLSGHVLAQENPQVLAETLASIRATILNSGIFERVLGLAAAENFDRNLKAAFGATDILHQCMLQCREDPELNNKLGEERRNRILSTLTSVLFGSDYGLAVLASKGLIAALDDTAEVCTTRMSFRTAVKVVVMRRIFTRRKKAKKRRQQGSAGTTSGTENRTLRVI